MSIYVPAFSFHIPQHKKPNLYVKNMCWGIHRIASLHQSDYA